ncbi:hypothetical protein A7975_10735 [Bacillus sp. FJAT-26390]|nr:hypothetical protein A7975_10735 [Bacillus sp. FJAT-26390]
MFGLGKQRTKLGRYIDKNGITQGWLESKTGLNKNSVSKLCGDDSYEPRPSTVQKVISSLRKHGHDVRADDFWG